MKTIIIEDYIFDKVLLDDLKKEAKEKYKKHLDYSKQYHKIKHKRISTIIKEIGDWPKLGVVNDKFQIHFKTNLLKYFNSFLFIDLKSKKHIYIN